MPELTNDTPNGIAAPLRCDVLGYAVELIVPDAEDRQAVTRLLSPFPAAEEGAVNARYTFARDAEAGWHLYDGDALLRTDQDRPTALLALEWHVVTAAIDRRRDLFHLHGAALAPPDGNGAVLVVGASGSGKTTLALGLMARGFLPYSDDVILIEPASGTLRALPRAFHLRAPTRALVQALDPPDTWQMDAPPNGFFLPPRWAQGTPTVCAVLLPELRPDQPPALVPLAPPDAAHALLSQTVTLEYAPAVALATVARLTAHATCYRLTMGDLAQTVALVRSVLASRPLTDQ